jgi:ribose transport system permease protein
MAKKIDNRAALFILKNMPIILFIVIFIGFSLLDKRFFTTANFENILRSSSFVGIIAVGMTFVLLTGGIDLSVGAVMYVAGAILGLLLEQDVNIWLAIGAALLSGLVFGTINAFLITRLKLIPFMATLGTLTAGRGFGLVLTQSRALTFPDSIKVGAVKLFDFYPLPVFIFTIVVIVAVVILLLTPLGRQIYAMGNDLEAAKKAGLKTDRLTAFVYVLCSFFASLAAVVAVSQQGRVSASFGSGIEFRAIAGSVLGGISLFGGVGSVFPGTVIGIMLIQMIQTGMVYLQIDGYLQDIVVGLVIFFAIFIDAQRMGLLRKLERRTIRVEKGPEVVVREVAPETKN